MQSPVDRVENAARPQQEPVRLRKTAESAKEKDDKFSKVLREKMKDELQEKRKQKKRQDELLLSSDTEELAEKTKPTVESAEPDEESSEPNSEESAQVESIDLRA